MDETVAPAVEDTAADIASMEVRGAAAIALATADALAAQADASDAETSEEFRADLCTAARRLYETRPTAVTLANAIRFVFDGLAGDDVESLRRSVREARDRFETRLDRAQSDLGAVGASRLADGDTVMTHCHSTDALACVEAAVDQGKAISAIVKETRPRKQGHITASALRELGVPVTVIVDSAARRSLDDADHVLVGADSITADGTVVNKIGTSGLAVIARERGVPVTTAAQTIKLDPATLTGATVEIEQRAESEVLDADARAEIGDVAVRNPAFDGTPARFVDAIVTERGQFPPQSAVTLMRDIYGEQPTRPWIDPS